MHCQNEWTVARAVAPPPRPECDLYQRALDLALNEALTRLDVLLDTEPDTEPDTELDAGRSGDATSGTSR